MEISVKKEAEAYFNNHPDFEKVHNQITQRADYERFYLRLIARYVQTDQLIPKINLFYAAKKLAAEPLINAVWGYSLMLTQQSKSFKFLADFISEIDKKNIVDRALLMKSLSENILDAANIEKKPVLQKKAKRAFTKYYYDQKKHNLLRENNEGYARICLLLASMTKNHQSQVVWNKILSLIGNFDLDPDRILDLLIESYIQSSNSQVCLQLLKNFNPQSVVVLIGNRILKDTPVQIAQKLTYAGKVEDFLTSTSEQIFRELSNIPNPKLITLTCQLIKCSFISTQLILPYLSPTEQILEKQQIKRLQNGKQKILKSFKLMMEELTQEQILKNKEQENVKFYGQMLHSPRLAIINGFITINDWGNFKKVWLTVQDKIDLIVYQPLLKSLLSKLEWVIQPLYNRVSYAKYFKPKNESKFQVICIHDDMEDQQRREMTQAKSLDDNEFEKIVELFDIIKIYIGFHSKLFIKICRLFSSIIRQSQLFQSKQGNQSALGSQARLSNYIKQSVERIVKEYLLPGMSLQTGNSGLAKEIFQLLEVFDYRFRYRCYLYHYAEGMVTNPCLAHVFYKTRNKQIVIVNNLSDKNKKVFMKKMAKLTHNQALQTFYWIFRRIMMEDYEKVVPEIVGVLGSCSSLTLEMSVFIALHILNQQKQPAMNFRTGQQSPWFKNLINYISLFYRKHLEVDIQPVFDYIIMKIGQDVSELENNEQLPGGLLGLLHELLSKMFCNFVLKQVNKSKLEMLCAGPYLQLQAMDISSEIKASKKSKVILEKFFWGKSVDQYDGQSLAISLLVLLTQKRAQVLHKSYISNLKIIGDIYDDYTTLIIQLIRVLNELSNDYNKYSKLLPQNSLNLLINQYKLPLQIAFEIFRPSIKHISTMNNDQWSKFVKYIGDVFDKFVLSENKYIYGYSENESLKGYLTENYSKVTTVMTNDFFTTFWMLTLDSIYFPSKLYIEKIQQVKKKAESKVGRGRNDRAERQTEKAKTLYTNLKQEEISQSKKAQDTNESNLFRLKLDYLKNVSKDEKNSNNIQQFAEIFTQVCLLPRMMLDPEEALYCMKITIEVIKVNKLSSSKSIKLLIFIIEHVMNSLPYATQRQASYCLAIFLSEILSLICNWNDQTKLKQDLKKWLGIEENFVDENFARLKKQIIKLYIRFGNIIKSIKQEPYIIRNCLYLLEKVDTIPAYKKQAEDLEIYLKELKQKYSLTLQTIIEMQLSIIGQKKKSLPVIDEEIQPSISRLEAPPTFSNININFNSNIETKNVQSTPPPSQTIAQVTLIANKNDNVDGAAQKSQKNSVRKSDISSQRFTNKPDQKIKAGEKQGEKIKLQTPISYQNDLNESKQLIRREVLIGPAKPEQKRLIKQPTEKILTPQRVPNMPVSEKKLAEPEKIQESKQENVERIKTVKQLRDENARKAAQQSTSTNIQQNTKITIQPQQNEKIKNQSQKDQGPQKNQKTSWLNQNQKEKTSQQTVQSTMPPTQSIQLSQSPQPISSTVDFIKKGNIQNKDYSQQNNPQSIRTIQEDLEPKQNQIKQKQNITIVQIKQKPIQQMVEMYPSKTLSKGESQGKAKERQISQQNQDKKQKNRDSKYKWPDKQDKYSPNRNQDRQYKKEFRFEKREQRWKQKQREDHRGKYNQDRQRRKDSRDRSRRKEDKYDRQREKGRKSEHKLKDRSRDRDHDYRK